MNIDIKTVLLTSLSSNKTLRGSHRLYFGKSCFIIKYEVRGKFLTINNVKKTFRKHSAWGQRLQRKRPLIKLYQLKIGNSRYKQNVSADGDKQIVSLQITETQKLIIDNVRLQSKETQTMKSQIPPTKISATTEMENISITTSAQQAIASAIFNLKKLTGGHSPSPKSFTLNSTNSCQTELYSETKGIQCKRPTLVKATQTDEFVVKSSYTQVWEDSINVGSPKNSKDTFESNPTTSAASLAEKEVVVYMLNEIGELVLNQNQILNNNTKMLGQISEMTMLTRMVALGKAWSKRRFMKKEQMCPHKKCNKQQFLEVKTFKKGPTKEIIDKIHRSIQTERKVKPEMFQKSTQTKNDFIKPRKLSFLRKKEKSIK